MSSQHKAYAKAFSLYTDLLNERLTGESPRGASSAARPCFCLSVTVSALTSTSAPSPADVHIFNALILAAPLVREKYAERWELMEVTVRSHLRAAGVSAQS